MYPLSDAAKDKLKKSHVVTSATFVDNTALGRTERLYPTAAQVNAEDGIIRRRCTLTLPDHNMTLVPEIGQVGLLSPYGSELRMYRGLLLDDGSEVSIPLGIFRISEVRVVDSGGGVNLTVTGYDRARRVSRAKLLDYYVITAGTNYVTAIQDLITARAPGVVFNFATTTATTPRLVFDPGADPWEKAQKMAEDIGMELFFDVGGVCVMAAAPDPTTQPAVWDFVEGANATVLYVDRKTTDEGVYNHVIVSNGASGTATVRAEALDNNTDSATYYLGPFGDVPLFFSSEFITTVDQAQTVADARLAKEKSQIEILNLSVIPNPALAIGDIVRVVRGRAGVNANYKVTSFMCPQEVTQPMPVTVVRTL
jgi:hypothetical protein